MLKRSQFYKYSAGFIWNLFSFLNAYHNFCLGFHLNYAKQIRKYSKSQIGSIKYGRLCKVMQLRAYVVLGTFSFQDRLLYTCGPKAEASPHFQNISAMQKRRVS